MGVSKLSICNKIAVLKEGNDSENVMCSKLQSHTFSLILKALACV